MENLTNKAYELSNQSFSYEQIIEALKTEDITLKQICALRLSELKSPPDADLFLSNLVNQDGKVREAIALRLDFLFSSTDAAKYFQKKSSMDILIKGVMDINPNVCRSVIGCLEKIDNKKYLVNEIILKASGLLSEIDELKKFSSNKSHALNKKVFNLYWLLESLTSILDKDRKPLSKLIEILEKTSLFDDYTIREKVAKLASLYDNSNQTIFLVKQKLKQDENFYVRAAVKF